MKSKNALRLAVLCAVVSACSVPVMAAPATNPPGQGPGVAIGTGSNAPKAENVAIGKNAMVQYTNGSSAATGDVVVGSGANVNNYASQGGSVAIGKNAHVENMAGGQEASFAFGQTNFSGSMFSSSRIPADPTKVVGSVAVGDNTFARTGSTMIGSHNYSGALGDTNVTSNSTRTDALSIYATTVGANSFSNGAFTTNTGTYNIISSDYNGGRMADFLGTAAKNLGATVNGSFNSIESKTASESGAGVANAITGIANRTQNANGALIYGAGNVITNSMGDLSNVPTDGGNSAKAFANSLRSAIHDSEGGGATMAFGGGNKADYTLRTAMIGVNNTVTGTSGSEASDNFVVGFNNTGTNVQGTTIIGTNRTATGTENSIIMGAATNPTTTAVNNAVVLGTDANVTVAGGVALGANSIASRGANEASGYDRSIDGPSSDTSSTWKPTDAAVSVGDGTTHTRRITFLAAGSQDTDAVNVAQLKKVVADSGNQNNIINNRINKLDGRMDKVGAGAAALAALHPLDFDPDAKWDFAAGYGNYAGSNATAIGAYYRPNEDVMVSVAGTMGTGENMVNAGLSLKFGGVKGVSKSRVALGKEVLALKQEVAELKAMLGAQPGLATQGANRTTVFPDVPSNHWAYQAVQGLADKGLVEGYPDGTFGGDKMMTRYEFASIIYRAVQKGALVDERLVKEFGPELALFRVDTIKKDKAGNPEIQRVRVNHQEKAHK